MGEFKKYLDFVATLQLLNLNRCDDLKHCRQSMCNSHIREGIVDDASALEYQRQVWKG